MTKSLLSPSSIISTFLFLPIALAFLSPATTIIQSSKSYYTSQRQQPTFLSSSIKSTFPSDENTTTLKTKLLHALQQLRNLQARDGDFSVDFGVKGGELNKTSRAPQKVSYYGISQDVGKAADDVMSICDHLAEQNPTLEPTKYLGNSTFGDTAPLNGVWKLLFTTAADASFSKNSTRGDAQAQNVVNAKKGRITNIVDFLPSDDSSSPPTTPDNNNDDNKKKKKDPVLKQLNVVIKAVASSPTRVELTFRYVRVVLNRFFFLPIRWSLYIPVPGPFITRCIVLFSRLLSFGRKGIKKVPKAYFDVLYLDDDLRIHRTGEDNLFVQAKDSWMEAQSFLKNK